MNETRLEDRGLWSGLLGDGRPLLAAMALALTMAGLFALFLGIRGEFLPHDMAYLGMKKADL